MDNISLQINIMENNLQPPEEKENNCLYCGEPCDKMYCSIAHKNEDLN